MSIWNKILLGFIFVAAVAFFYMAMRTLKTRQYWRELAQAHEAKIQGLQEENLRLVEADPEEGEEDEEEGIVRLRLELHNLLIGRGRVWYNCEPGQVDPQTGRVAVKTDLPDPHRITANTLMYVFEETDVQDQGRYLGEFNVTQVAQQQVALEPTMKATAERLERLTATRGPWTLYEEMPTDAHSIFSHASDDEKKAMLPAGTVAEFLKDGQPAEPDDPEERVVELEEDGEKVKKYARMLRDYEVLFKSYHQQRSILFDLVEAATRDKQYVDAAYTDSVTQQQFREEEVRKLKAAVAKYQRERGAVAALHTLLKPRVEGMKVSVQRLIAANQAIAGRIAQIQLDATRRIDARTQSMAVSGPGGD